MTPVYAFKAAAHFPEGFDREAAARRLGELLEAHGDLSTDAIIAEAKPKRSVLHSAFTWDPSVALDKLHEAEAAYLRRTFIVIREQEAGPPREYRAVLSVKDDNGERRSVATEQALRDPDYRGQVLAQCLRELVAIRRKYSDLEELARVFDAIDKAARKKAA